ncbi:c-type cytochrome [Thermus sp. PS18]|uniref:c-type cytochrome n=1 Tax=Thermus sp. PS18 TaxID=2849039 RepID=UPI002264BC59|nr:c-type cytochrome [Thermus sp. PS18]UZX14684.1 c-type cytochrome [Thermus sp. PS18]
MRRKQEPLGLTQTILLALLVAFAGTTFYFALNYLALREQGVSKGSATANISGSIPALPQDFPESLDQTVALGKDIFMNTKDHPLSKAYVGNALSCTSCHLNGGTDPKGLTLVGTATAFPAYSPREKAVITLQNRIGDCFMRSLNGTLPPLGGPVLVALEAYIASLSQGMPLHMNPKSPTGPNALKPLSVDWTRADAQRGKSLYQAKCAVCHGAEGQGQVGPPLWGPKSYNAGAGMANWKNLAAFVHGAMPLGNPNLSPDEARDIAAYVDSQPRPTFRLQEHLPPSGELGVYTSKVLDEVKEVQPVRP